MAALKPNPDAQFQTSGYVISEDGDMILRDLFASMEAVARAYDMDQGGAGQNFDLTGDQVAAVIRSWVRLGKMVLTDAPFAIDATAWKREI